MKIVLSCGHPLSNFQIVHEVMRSSGLVEAKASEARGLLPQALLEKLYLAHDQPADGLGVTEQINPGKLWNELAADLFMANMAEVSWGWADYRTLWTLDFWASFDAQIRFLLVYSSPAHAVGRALGKHAVTRSECEQIMHSWVICNAALLRFYHRNAERCLLLNAAAAIKSPSSVAARVSEDLGVALAFPQTEYQPGGESISTLTACLVKPLVEEFDDATELFRELESTADIDGTSCMAESEEPVKAMQEYLDLMGQLKKATGDECETLTLAVNEKQHSLDRAIEELGHLSQLNNGLVHENKRLLVQLHQVRSDHQLSVEKSAQLICHLEKSLNAAEAASESLLQVDTERLSRQLKLSSETPAASAMHSAPLYEFSEVLVDMTGPIDGDNWYYAEKDGRWAGPNDASAIRIPKLRDGTYEMRLEIVDAMAEDIVSGLVITLNGAPLQLRQERKGVKAQVFSRFLTSIFPEEQTWQFVFNFPRLISPAEKGSKDLRVLAIRVRSLKLARTG